MMKVLLMIILLSYFLCGVYCSYRKRRSTFKGIESYQQIKSEESVPKQKNAVVAGQSFKRNMINFIYRWLDSILRFCLLVTSYIPSHHLRNFLYRVVFRVTMGEKVVIYYGAEIRSPWNLYIDEGAVIGDKSTLDARSGIYIGKNVNFSSQVAIWTLQHDVNSPDFSVAGEGKPVFIFDRVWVSTRAVVFPGCVLKEGSVIAGEGTAQKIRRHLEYMVEYPARKLVPAM